MVFRTIRGLLIPLLLSTNVWADTLLVNPTHPDQYTVIKGDTLWDISAQFLQNPWQWSLLWKNNAQIKNPHLIYPGDVLYFSMVDGQPRLRLANQNQLVPRIREESVNKAVKLIPADAIAQFLSSPKVMNIDELQQSPYIIDIGGEHIIAGAGDRIYVRSIMDPQNMRFTVYRQGEVYKNAETHEILGYEAQYVADAQIERSGDPATLRLLSSNGEVRKGDRLMVSSDAELTLNYFPQLPAQNVSGSIISVLNGVTQIGRYNIVVVDKGQVDGLQEGHTLSIYQRGKSVTDPFSHKKNDVVKLPDEVAGLLMIFRVFDRVSYGFVLEANQSIHVLDKVRSF